MKLNVIFKYVLPIVIAGVLIWFTFKNIDIAQMWENLKGANYGWIVLSALPMTLSHLSRARRWQLLLEPLGKPSTTYNAFLAVMSGYFANLIIPRMGEVTRCSVLYKKHRIPVNESVGTVVVERVFDVVGLLIITALAFVLQFKALSTFFADMLEQKKAGAPGESGESFPWLILLALALLGIAMAYVLWSKRRAIAQNPLGKKVIDFLLGLWDGIASITKMNKPWEFLFHTVFIWVCYFLTLYISYYALPFTANLGLLSAFTILVVGSYGMVAPVQGGVGAYHYVVTAGLVALDGLSTENAAAAATLFHTATTLYVLILGGLCSILIWKERKVE